MQNITEIINIIEKSWGVNSISCPFGSCTEKFANEKMIEIANKNNFPDDILKLIKDNPIKFHKYQKFDNGRGIGRYYANLVRHMKWGFQKKGEIMSQSNYEKYAVIKQQELLHKERNLQQAISCLRDRRKFASLQSIDSSIDFVADLYDLSIDEIKRAMDGEEYWCV